MSSLLNARRPRLNVLISLLVAVMIVLSLGLALWLFAAQQRSVLEQAEATRVTDLARVVSGMSEVRAVLASDMPKSSDAQSVLQRDIDGLRRVLEVDFIVVMTPVAQRLTHPEPRLIGQRFQGDDEGPALAGSHYASRSQGSLGTSIRGFAPVVGEQGEVIGAVSVGVTLASLLPSLEQHRRQLWLGIAILMLAAALGAGWLARYIKRVLLGLEPHQIARLVEERQAMLASVHEGILAVDREGRITLANEAARALFARAGLGEPPLGTPLTDYIPHAGLPKVLTDLRPVLDGELLINGQVLLVNRVPIRHLGEVIGAVATLRDKSEVARLAEELTGVKRYAEALRASTHDFKNKLHVITGLAKLGDLASLRRYLRELADDRLASSSALGDEFHDPVLAGFLLGKRSEARERGIELTISAASPLPGPADPALGHTLVTVIGNLLENAFEALVSSEERRVGLTLGLDEQLLTLEVQDTGPGIDEALQGQVFERGVSTKGDRRGLGLALVKERIAAHEGTLSLYSSPGRGTLIEVALPYLPSQSVASEELP
ncbi:MULTISPECIES: ATP-binding protein [Halomonadaceae]|uniref:ATP-binding protein n=1 Tax=Halomonadaceae TaxID=28256 RepID=UPI002010AC19|nr:MULTISPECIES: ATP-binding protein [unclassified Halomonas]